MKIFTSTQIKELDKYTIEQEPINSIDLMERAARAIKASICERWSNITPFVVFAGPGNNGGDALAVARLLANEDYDVSVFLFNVHNSLSPDCETNKQRLLESNRVSEFTEVSTNFDPPHLNSETVVIDGLFGSGINKPLSGGFASLVKYINQSPCKVVSIDIPSGLMPEDNTYNIKQNVINANLTLTIQQKKLSMLLPDCQRHLGELKVIDIRLSKEYIDNTSAPYYVLEENDISSILKTRDAFSHKGIMGNALIIAGSLGMAGASILASRACLRTGVGKLTTHIPQALYTILQTAIPEAMVSLDASESIFSEAINSDCFNAIGIGPGLGKNETTAIALIAQIKRAQCPIVIDADAINILGSHRAWIQQLPKGIILTPHPKELELLVGSSSTSSYELLTRASEFAQHFECYIILKGHYSALCLPDGNVVFNSTGNAGMATAGCGDVLTGMITALLARGYKQKEACIIGMYLHGLAGDIAEKTIGQESLIASDVIDNIYKAFNRLND